jgi:NAD(P)-dependent dehydrogenase (short-subunit alcohol dehydrogenase family)
MELGGTVAVITGGASGIGRGTALAFARAGAAVVVADVHEARTAETLAAIREIGGRAIGVRCDVTSDADVDALADTTLAELGRVDVIMNNAGVSVMGPPERVPMDDWRWQLDVNLLGVVRGVRAFVPHLVAQGSGWVVNTASIAGLYAYSYDAIPYITSKHAVVGLSEGLHLYLRPQGIGVSVLCPGLVATNLGESARLVGADDPAWTNFPQHLRRPIDPGDVGEMVVGAVRDERFLILTHPEERAVIAAHGTDRDAFLKGYLPRLYAGRDERGLPTNAPVRESVSSTQET